jgi:hypothetical protein
MNKKRTINFDADNTTDPTKIEKRFNFNIQYHKSTVEVTEISFPLANTYNCSSEDDYSVMIFKRDKSHEGINLKHGRYHTFDDLIKQLNKQISVYAVSFKVLLYGKIMCTNNVSASKKYESVVLSPGLCKILGFNLGPDGPRKLTSGQSEGENLYDSNIGQSFIILKSPQVRDADDNILVAKLFRNAANFTWGGNVSVPGAEVNDNKISFTIWTQENRKVPVSVGNIVVRGRIHLNNDDGEGD